MYIKSTGFIVKLCLCFGLLFLNFKELINYLIYEIMERCICLSGMYALTFTSFNVSLVNFQFSWLTLFPKYYFHILICMQGPVEPRLRVWYFLAVLKKDWYYQNFLFNQIISKMNTKFPLHMFVYSIFFRLFIINQGNCILVVRI